MTDVQADILEQYRASLELVERIEADWVAQGKPLLAEGGATGKALVPHPLVKMLGEARRDAVRFARLVKPARPGRPQVGVPSVAKAPSAEKNPRLRVAKSA